MAVSQISGKVDIVWVIDNSGSMADNILKVRANFDAFSKKVSASVDARIILLSSNSATNPKFGLSLPASAMQSGAQIDFEVGSKDPMQIALAASCPASSTVLPQAGANSVVARTICGVPVSSHVSRINAVKGKMFPLLRPETPRIYVFVTDDDAMPGDSNLFLQGLMSQFPSLNLKVFAFRGVQASGACTITRPGAQYNLAAKATGGETYDICQNDWSTDFDKLSKSVINLASTGFNLKATPKEMSISVTVDGVPVDASGFKVVGQNISLIVQPDPTKEHKIQVTYTPQ